MLATARSTAWSQRGIAGVGFALVALLVTVTVIAMTVTTYDIWAAFVIAPILLLISVPILARSARREGDTALFGLLLLALSLKLIGALVRYYVDFHVYLGQTDAAAYHEVGISWSEALMSGNVDTQGQALSGTNFLGLLTGIIYTITRPTLLGGYLVFSWLSFWGLFLFYRAFAVAVPEGRKRTYAAFVLFLPSLLFWPSGTGKDAWMVLALGIACFGGAQLLSGRALKGIGWLASGLWAAALVRPHVAAIAGISFGVSVGLWALLRGGSVPFSRKAIGVAAAAVIAFSMISSAERFLARSNVSTEGGVTAALDEIERRTAQGGSEFAPFVVDSPARFPPAAFTVLFRPSIIEADYEQAKASAIEATVLLLICIVRFRWILAAVRSIRRQPYVLFAVVFTLLFIIAFSAEANFGILVRQRVQVLPLFVVLLAVPPGIRTKIQSHGAPISRDIEVRV